MRTFFQTLNLVAILAIVTLPIVLVVSVQAAPVVPTTGTISSSTISSTSISHPPPIVYTIAGSDSGGGAGIQADLHAIHSMKCHGCSAITCLTAQSSTGVYGVHSPPVQFLRLQLDTLKKDLPPRAVKIGMLGSKELAMEVGSFLQDLKETMHHKKNPEQSQQQYDQQSQPLQESPFVVLDPVMISTSGHKLIQDDTKEAIVKHIFPYVDIITPNKYEAEEILGRTLDTFQDVEQGARDIINMGVKSVLIKGGHLVKNDSSNHDTTLDSYAQDYFLSSEGPLTENEERICDGNRGVWLRSKRYDSIHTHGTGCTLSSCIASALAIGHAQRSNSASLPNGADRAIRMIDACCLAKAYVTAGVAAGVPIGQGPGPVVHTSFPSKYEYFPEVALHPEIQSSESFLKMQSTFQQNTSTNDDVVILGELLPIVDDIEWLERLTQLDNVKDIQLRIKGETDREKIFELVQKCQDICKRDSVRLWVNDFWEAAIKANCFGVHVGQEDLAKCADAGGLELLKKNSIALGISTHSYAELAAAKGIKPSYISLGPIFGTKSKNVAFDAQGLETLRQWRNLIDPGIPLVVIGGINDADRVKQVREAGADCVAVIGAVKTGDCASSVEDLCKAMR
jgi:hydroxymethylpyrimidine kinase / phosphomethylpyrimidine kinase / thiamine-phosphate diphosphorylase